MNRTSQFPLKTITLFLLAAALIGCATTPRKSGFLSDYSGMTGRYDLDQVRTTGANLASYETLVIASLDTSHLSTSLADDDRANILESLETNFRSEMSRHFKTVTTDASQAAPDAPAVRLELAVTELEPTDVAQNLIVGFGVGNATGSIEGRFLDAQTGRELAAFADRKKGSPFTKKEYTAQIKFPNWSKLQYLYVFTEIWAENTGNLVKSMTE